MPSASREMPLRELMAEEALPAPVHPQPEAQPRARSDWGMAWENVPHVAGHSYKGGCTSQTARGPSDVGSHHRRENSRRAGFLGQHCHWDRTEI